MTSKITLPLEVELFNTVEKDLIDGGYRLFYHAGCYFELFNGRMKKLNLNGSAVGELENWTATPK